MAVKWLNVMKWTGLACIFCLALLLRFWHFPGNPPSLNWDEVSMGYNAYSIVKTGRDGFGNYLPKFFRSLDDYKTPVYTYLTAASIGIFGINDFAVRAPSAFLGVLTVVLLYMLVKELFEDGFSAVSTDKKSAGRFRTTAKVVAILSAALLAIAPWHVQFSRMGLEANVGLFFLVAGVTLFLLGIHKNHWLLPVSVICLGASAYSYRSLEVIAPLMGGVLTLLYGKQLFALRKKIPLLLSVILVICFGASMVQDIFSDTTNIRIQGTSVFDSSDTTATYFQNSLDRLYDVTVHRDLFSRIFHNNRLVTVGIIVKGYLVHFSPTFWFFDYDQRYHYAPSVSLLYLWMLLFIPVGAYYLIRNISKRSSTILFAWLLISPIPASVTRDVPNAIRVLPMLIPLVVMTASGIYAVYEKLGSHSVLKYTFALVMFSCAVFSSAHYFHQYDVHLPLERSKDWVYGMQQLVEYIEERKDKYKKIVISTRLEWPHIFFLYYSKYDPVKYLAQGGTVSGGFAEEGNHYDMYQFRKLRASEDFITHHTNDTLYAGLPNEFPDRVTPLQVIRYLNGKPAIWIVDGSSL
jgi:4-amino-4-deoxy-L-arabinose transferase-like glycosyltransferase